MIKFGEFAPDAADYNLELARVAENVIPIPNGYKSVRSEANNATITQSVKVPGTIPRKAGAMEFVRDDGPSTVYKILCLEPNTGSTPKFFVNGNSFENASAALQTTFEGYSIVRWKDSIYIWGCVSPAQKISETGLDTLGTTKTSFVGGSPPDAWYATRVRRHIVLGHTLESGTVYPSRVWWSAFDDPDGWTAGDNQANFIDLPEGGRVTGFAGGDYGVVFQDRAITRMDYIGTPRVWEFSPIIQGIGCIAPSSIVQSGDDIYFLGIDGFYLLRNGQELVPIGKNKVDRYIFSDVNTSLLQTFHEQVQGARDSTSGSIWWAYPGATVSDRFIVYHPKFDQWTTATTDIDTRGIVAVASQADDGLDFTNAEQYEPGIVFWRGNTTNVSQRDFTGSSYKNASIETGLIYTEGRKTTVRTIRPLVDASVTITLAAQADAPTDAEVGVSAQTVDASGKCDFRSHARYHRILCATTAVGFSKATGVEVEQVPRGTR